MLPLPARSRPTRAVAARAVAAAVLAAATAAGAAAAAAAPSGSPSAGSGVAPAASPGVAPVPCRLSGVEFGALCGSVRRPLDPNQAAGVQIDVHYAVLPAVARNKKPDPVFVFAGGPGQGAIGLASTMAGVLARLGNRRDIVLVDQRGTGRSAPLACPPVPPSQALAESTAERVLARLRECRAALQKLPHGDLRYFTTHVAMADIDAVRRALGAERINLVGGSYGTRAALEYQRQFPQAVRRAVLDGAAPPDMVLPQALAADAEAALERVFAACEQDAACRERHPALRARWGQMLDAPPRTVRVTNPLNGLSEPVEVSADLLRNLVRAPLYVPALAAALPPAIAAAADGRLEPLAALGASLATRRELQLAEGMHFSVVCSEDVPPSPAPAAVGGAASGGPRGAGIGLVQLYAQACTDWPRGEVPAAFYRIGPASAATLVLSGGADPATPPRHGERVARALGAKARHVVVAEAGHGLMGLPCMRDVLFRFIDAYDDAAALSVPADCAAGVPRPPVFASPGAASAPGVAR